VRAPRRYDVRIFESGRWVTLPARTQALPRPAGRRANIVSFAPRMASRVRVVFVPRRGAPVGLSELEIWGAPPTIAATAPPRDLAFGARVSASFTAPNDHVEQVNDLQVALTRYSRNRWTALGSPSPRDWVEVDFGEPKSVRTMELYFWGDGDRIRAPKSYSVQLWQGNVWRDARILTRRPSKPLASARNVVTIEPVRASRVRIVLEHDLPAVSGITEVVVLP